MATRQYIGARYVPKFYKNSNDGSTQWQPNVVYEPLMWVTLTNGHMYISRKEVPATVGTPADNIEWWLDVGSYNGWVEWLGNRIDNIEEEQIPALRSYSDEQDAALQQGIDAIVEEQIPALRSYVDEQDATLQQNIDAAVEQIESVAQEVSDIRTGVVNLMTFGDSWLEGGGWGDSLKLLMKATAYYNYGLGGTGFARPNFSTFHDQLDRAISELTSDEKLAITHVVIGGGINDQWDDAQTLYGNAAQMFRDCHTAFPNAKVYYFANYGCEPFTREYFEIIQALKNYAVANNVTPLDVEFCMMGAGSYFMQADNVHPTGAGYGIVATSVYAAMHGSHWDYFDEIHYGVGAVKTKFNKQGSQVICNIQLNPANAGDIPSGTYAGEAPCGKSSPSKTYWVAPVVKGASGQIVGTVLFTTGGLQIWGLDNVTGDCYCNAAFNIIGLVDNWRG